MSASPIEIEIKLPLPDPEGIEDRIARLGYSVLKPRVFEANTVYDTPTLSLRSAGQLLRVREVGGTCVLTWKGPASEGKHKSRPEVETTLGDARAFDAILRALGYQPTFRYEKYRTEFASAGEPGVITLDETPIGWFLELEGEPAWIDSTAHALGFDESQYVTLSYGALYFEYCRARGVEPSFMLFAS